MPNNASLAQHHSTLLPSVHPKPIHRVQKFHVFRLIKVQAFLKNAAAGTIRRCSKANYDNCVTN